MLVHAFKWSLLANLAPVLVTPIVLIVLARYLSPSDFAIVAMVTVVLTFVKVFRDGGLGQIIIQAKSSDIANVVFTLQLFLSLILISLLWIIAPFIGSIFKSIELIEPLRIASLELLVAPILDIPVFQQMREINFKAQFYRKALVPVVSGVISITLAMLGYGYWAVILGTVIGTYVTAALLTVLLHWRPSIDLDFSKIRDYWGFGGNMLLQGLVGWVINSVDKALLSHNDSKENVGYYEVASRASQLPFTLVSLPVNQVLYPLMRSKVNQGKIVEHYYLIATKLMAFIALPLSCFLLFYRDSIINLLLGEQWLPISEIFVAMGIGVVLATLVTINVEMYKAIGRTSIMSNFMIVRAMVSIPVYWLAAGYGVAYLAVSRAGLALVFSPVNTILLLRTAGITVSAYLKVLVMPVSITVLLTILFSILSSFLSVSIAFLIGIALIVIVYLYIGITEFYPLLKRK